MGRIKENIKIDMRKIHSLYLFFLYPKQLLNVEIVNKIKESELNDSNR